MMVIAFITIESGLVPLVLSDSFKSEVMGGLRSHLLLFFFKRKNLGKKKTVSHGPRSHMAS